VTVTDESQPLGIFVVGEFPTLLEQAFSLAVSSRQITPGATIVASSVRQIHKVIRRSA
jgi:hypothetical protein